MSDYGIKFIIALLLVFAGGQVCFALDYEKDVMPIFEVKCFECHSEKAKKQKGGLRLDDLEHFKNRFSKDELVTPGNPKLSGLYYSLTRPRHDKGAMPPENKGEQLTREEVGLVRGWIVEGAPISGTRGKPGANPGPGKKIPKSRVQPFPRSRWNESGRIVRE